jgi:hypothetical protein
LPLPTVRVTSHGHKWIAEDALCMAVARMVWRRDPKLRTLSRLVRGDRIYAIWSNKDKRPFLNSALAFLARLAWAVTCHAARSLFYRFKGKRSMAYERGLPAKI